VQQVDGVAQLIKGVLQRWVVGKPPRYLVRFCWGKLTIKVAGEKEEIVVWVSVRMLL
jgi:hypothetical protein